MARRRQRLENHLNWSEKVPERSGKTDADRGLRKQLPGSRYGGPVLERKAAGRL